MAGVREKTESSSDAQSAAGALTNGTVGGNGPILMDLDFVRHLIEAVDESGIDTLEITRAGTRIRISKSPTQTIAAAPAASASASGAAEVAQAPGPAAAVATESEPAPAAPADNLTEVKSPMVGTFYRAPAPEAPPYVDIGSTVSKGQTLCILEAMKLMNELESEVDGVVREILVENTDPVEFGQVLFRVEPATSAGPA